MDPSTWFDDQVVIGAMSPQDAATKLREIGEENMALAIEETAAEEAQVTRRGADRGGKVNWLPFGPKAWQHTAHALGFLRPAAPETIDRYMPIVEVGNIEADPSLKNRRIKVTLNRLRIKEYPGGGMHRVLIDFYAQNQLTEGVEHLHFNATYSVPEGEHAAIRGYPIFVGLNVGSEGVAFKAFTVNVQNDQDEAFLKLLETDAFKAGLQLAETIQPAIAPFSSMTVAVTKSIAERNRNVPVQDIFLGLDFGSTTMGARLAEGDYIAIQIPEQLIKVWNWPEWVYDRETGYIVNKSDLTQTVPYNYFVFGISRHDDS